MVVVEMIDALHDVAGDEAPGTMQRGGVQDVVSDEAPEATADEGRKRWRLCER